MILADRTYHWGVVLIGLTDEAVEDEWVWLNGDPVNYTNWGPTEPNGWYHIDWPDSSNVLWGPEYNAAINLYPGLAGFGRLGVWLDYDAELEAPLPDWNWLTEETMHIPAIVEVEANPFDGDGDGISDDEDDCPDVASTGQDLAIRRSHRAIGCVVSLTEIS